MTIPRNSIITLVAFAVAVYFWKKGKKEYPDP
jgi:hypothetical protein